jgi:hypothetical protein
MPNANSKLAEIQEQLQKALGEGAKLESDYQTQLAKLQPLRDAVNAKTAEINSLIQAFQRLTNATVPTKGKRVMKRYSITNESKLAAQSKRSYTRAINQGMTEKQAKQIATDAEKKLAAKLGMSK